MPLVLQAPTVSAAGALPGDTMPPTIGRAVRRLAEIACRRHHHHPRVDRPLHGLAQRIVTITFEHWVAER